MVDQQGIIESEGTDEKKLKLQVQYMRINYKQPIHRNYKQTRLENRQPDKR